ncbi:MAG: hypothetical protein A3I77_03035 [Gammaproteobacteria bacterium RIFCSPLOWO2_02_FULL_42_14]|nr:MAG: hypothetical protein A3B71_08130 [Gammaproteobacteria bacterium RIFCSPHIGHO2_02_FULL_42_43]OGT28875.1 MAG: hypothetical protein A2624_05145 [Gammaproteobacteria bacterium RIFCSPHIGHO2_01_FULL_42_8]OGT52381.1 MAG: hypothetical protein A3E54_02005 [Gammaproteobacteria bacterium RIFCSPHIGHO2_12_FULL_41_25]OGT62491.1 MAG: hypothetical protein A3I77_03035 [Gammaproteobacteria bacterium RIFCSPLOWO2_02_FULL_42_14]OGT86295.1 MAG: hypothetical protein A3G86_07150 [Gammaproteobacteria bacterium R
MTESLKKDPIYRVLFIQNDKQYELYSKYLTEESLMGFIEIEELIFNDTKSGIVVDPTEEKLRVEFKDVKRTYIPMHAILRIDEVSQEGVARIRDCKKDEKGNVSHLRFSE